MAASTFRHTDDGGALSIFASGDEVLFACEKGHWWIASATSSGAASSAAKVGSDGLVPSDAEANDESLKMLNERFGVDVLKAMNLE